MQAHISKHVLATSKDELIGKNKDKRLRVSNCLKRIRTLGLGVRFASLSSNQAVHPPMVKIKH